MCAASPNKHGYQPDLREEATKLVLEQAALPRGMGVISALKKVAISLQMEARGGICPFPPLCPLPPSLDGLG